MNIDLIMNETKELHETTSKLKQVELVKNLSFETLQLIHFQLNKLIVTNISKKKIEKQLQPAMAVPENSMGALLSFLAYESTGKDSDVAVILGFINQYGYNEEFIKQIATKSVPLRVGPSTFNKALKEKFDNGDMNVYEYNKFLAPVFDVQLSNNIDKLKQSDIDNLGTVFVTEKLDGVRVIAQNIDGEWHLFSRSGKEFLGLNDIINELNNMSPEYVYDGELLAINQSEKAEDTFRSTMKIIGSKGVKTGITFNIFDFVTKSEFAEGVGTMPYAKRRLMLDYFDQLTHTFIKVVPVLLKTDNFNDVKDSFNTLVENGAEGVMLNKATAPYLAKRNNGILKYKQVYDSEGIVQDIFEGQGEMAGMLGGIIVNYRDTIVRIGTGFSEQQRIDFWNNPELIIGKLAQYRYTSVSHNQNNDNVSLRFARFITLREDKNEESFDN